METKPNSKSKPVKKQGSILIKQTSSIITDGILSMEFEVQGKVQGVHFRKYTQAKGKSLGLRGWCQNSNYATVLGCIEGPRLQVDMMKDWLRRTGSPKSKITAVEFKNVKTLQNFTYEDFNIIK